MSQELPFDPFPYIDDPHKQTIMGSLFTSMFDVSSVKKIVPLPDGDKIALQITTPSDWKPTDLTVMFVHGLCGSHKSPNLVRMVKRLEPLGVRGVRFNMRGCGSGKGFAKRPYHSGRSDDIFECLKVLKNETPESPIILVGFSLGGNLVLKLAGELNQQAPHFLKGVIAISPPVELASSIQMIGEADNAFYEKYFYSVLRSDVHYRHGKFKDLPPINLPRNLKLYEFDQLYTAPACGFESAMDYYNKCSASHFVGDIAIPTKVLLSKDDPIISPSSFDAYALPSNVSIFTTKKGGHLGYLGTSSGKKCFYWLDSLLVDWILDF